MSEVATKTPAVRTDAGIFASVADSTARYSVGAVTKAHEGMFKIDELRIAVERHLGGGTPSRSVASYWNGDIPWASVKDFDDNRMEIASTQEAISLAGLSASASNLIPAGIPLVCTRMAVGRAALATVPMAINQDVKALFPAQGVDARHLLRLLHYVQPKAEAISVGSTVKGVRVHDYLSIFVPQAPIDEQPRIARVLDTLDTIIRQTEVIIAKLTQVKQGLLHDLLTRGIDANGELRLPQGEAPHLYKQSPLGWIPHEWDTAPLGDVLEHAMDYRGRTPKKLGMNWGGGEILALSANNVQMGAIDLTREAYFGSEELHMKWMTHGDTKRGDVLLTMEAPLGNVAKIPDDRPYILSQRVVLLRFDPQAVISDFAYWQLMSASFQRAMIKQSTGTTATGIQRARLVRLPMLVPSLKEQRMAAVGMGVVEERLLRESQQYKKLQQQKSGLMDDLLTGRVRVTPLLDTAATS